MTHKYFKPLVEKKLCYLIIQLLEYPIPPAPHPPLSFPSKNLDGEISATKSGTESPLVTKQPNFWGLFRFSKKWSFWFRISGFVDPLAIPWKRKELPEIRWWQKDGFLDFFLSDFWRYIGNEESLRRPSGVKTIVYFRAFKMFKKIQF